MYAKIVVAPLKSMCFNKEFLNFSCNVVLNCSFIVGLVKLWYKLIQCAHDLPKTKELNKKYFSAYPVRTA